MAAVRRIVDKDFMFASSNEEELQLAHLTFLAHGFDDFRFVKINVDSFRFGESVFIEKKGSTHWVDAILDGAEGGPVDESEHWFAVRDWVDGHVIWFSKDSTLATWRDLRIENVGLLDQFDENDYVHSNPSTMRLHVHLANGELKDGEITVGKLRKILSTTKSSRPGKPSETSFILRRNIITVTNSVKNPRSKHIPWSRTIKVIHQGKEVVATINYDAECKLISKSVEHRSAVSDFLGTIKACENSHLKMLRNFMYDFIDGAKPSFNVFRETKLLEWYLSLR